MPDNPRPRSAVPPFAARDTASREVEALLGPDTGQARLRAALASLGLDDATSRLADHEVAALVAPAVASGRLSLGSARASPRLLAQGTVSQAPPPPPPPAPAPPRAAPVAAPSAPEGTFDVNLDVAAMVQTLTDAASAGVPFCEECAKAAAAEVAAAMA